MLTLNYWDHAGKGPRINVTLSRGWGSQTLDHWVHQQLVKRTSCSCGYLRCGQVALRCVNSAVDKLTSGVLTHVSSAVDKLPSGVLPQVWTNWPQLCYLSCGQANLRRVTSAVDKLTFLLIRQLGPQETVLTLHLEKEMATHSNTLAWKIPRTEKPARLQSMGSQRARHDWATSLCLHFTLSGLG